MSNPRELGVINTGGRTFTTDEYVAATRMYEEPALSRGDAMTLADRWRDLHDDWLYGPEVIQDKESRWRPPFRVYGVRFREAS